MTERETTYFSKEKLFELLKADNVKSASKETLQKTQLGGDAGDLYKIGCEYELERKEFRKAFGFYFLSAEYDYALASEALGSMYFKGQDVSVDYHVALEWYLKAARVRSPQSYLYIGNMFLKGLGVKADITKAYEWFHKHGSRTNTDRYILTKEQKEKYVNVLIYETEEHLHRDIFRTMTYDKYKQMKNTEFNLISHIKVLQQSNATSMKMNQSLSAQLNKLTNDYNKLATTLKRNTAIAKREKKVLQRVSGKYNEELNRTLQHVRELQAENGQLFVMMAENQHCNEIEIKKERAKHKDNLDKEVANYNKAIKHLKEQHNAAMEEERQIHQKQIEERECAQESALKQEMDHLKEQLEEQRRDYFTIISENNQLKTSLNERQDTLNQSYDDFEREKANLDALIRFMQSTRDNIHQSSLELKRHKVHHSILTESAIHLREELDRQSDMRRKRRKGE